MFCELISLFASLSACWSCSSALSIADSLVDVNLLSKKDIVSSKSVERVLYFMWISILYKREKNLRDHFRLLFFPPELQSGTKIDRRRGRI